MFTKVLFAATFCIASVLSASADINTNRWTNAEGGDWSNAQNWSLGRIPQEADRVEFPDLNGVDYIINITNKAYAGSIFVDNQKSSGCPTVTFAGDGTLNIKAVQENYIRGYRKLVLDGVTVNLTGHYIMIYGLLELRNSAQFLNGQETRLWRDTPSITVGEGCRMECVGTIRNLLRSTITVNGGEFICSSIISDKDSTSPVNVTVNGGIFSVKNGEFSNTPTLSMSDGLFRVESTATFPHGATFNFTGGTLEVPILNPPQELLANKGNATIAYPPVDTVTMTKPDFIETFDNSAPLVFTSSSDFVFDFWQNNAVLGKEVNINGIVVVTNGCINFNREGYLYSDYPMFVKTFRIGSHNGSDTYGAPTIGVSEIVVGNEYPFATFDKRESVLFKEFNLEGPTIIKPTADVNAPTGNETFIKMSGDFVVDTQDYNNPDVKRVVRLYNVCATECTSLTVTGGGELKFSQIHSDSPFTRITIESNTTLTLNNLLSSIPYGPLHADEIVLEEGAVIKIPAGFNSVHAAKWTIAPTAKIMVIFDEGLTTEAKGILYDFAKVHTVQESQIFLCGATENWNLSAGDGAWIVVNALADTEPVIPEWTGKGENEMLVTPENWNGITKVLDDYTYYFGAGNKRTEMKFCNVYVDDNAQKAEASTINSFIFRNTATNSFEIYSTASVTLSSNNEYEKAGIFSESTVPQYIESPLRTASLHSLCAASEGSLIFKPYSTFFTKANNDNVWMRLVGDIRFGKTFICARLDFGVRSNEYAICSSGSRLTILNDGNVTYTNQHKSISQAYTGFRIEEGGALTFNNGSGKAIFQWKAGCCANHTINGLLNVDIPYHGGGNQSFSGKGTINIASIIPSSAKSTLSFGGNLTVNLPERWPTVTATDPDVPLTLKAYGSPTIYTEGDWSYGVFEEITNQEYTPSKRAAKIAKSSTLTFNPNGGTVTFGDPLSGKGTVAIMNGTLYIPGGVASSIGVKMCDKGAYRYDAAHELRSLVFEAGSKLRFTAPITVKERVNLDNLQIEWAEGTAPGRSKVWKTLLVSKAGFDGESAALDSKYHTRVANTDNGYEYQVRPKIGAVVTFR